jgi:hypothetical protein
VAVLFQSQVAFTNNSMSVTTISLLIVSGTVLSFIVAMLFSNMEKSGQRLPIPLEKLIRIGAGLIIGVVGFIIVMCLVHSPSPQISNPTLLESATTKIDSGQPLTQAESEHLNDVLFKGSDGKK